MYKALLETNLFDHDHGTVGAAFRLEIEMGEVLLSRLIQMEKAEYQDFVNVLESFVNHVEAWTRQNLTLVTIVRVPKYLARNMTLVYSEILHHHQHLLQHQKINLQKGLSITLL